MITCPRCDTTNPDGARFCLNCGAALTQNCPNCHTTLPLAARFCFNCGQKMDPKNVEATPAQVEPIATSAHRVPPELAGSSSPPSVREGERRIVTVLFCDVQGSTAIAEQLDPEEWAEIMNGAFQRLDPPIQRYEGTVVRLLGDAILAFFGAPVAHEDDPERAVLAALEMTEAIRVYGDEVRRRYGIEFTIRIGINTGLVVVGAMGSALRTEYTAMGDAVNVAARMEQTAAPGAVQVAHDTYRLVAPLFDVEVLGEIEIKGKSEPVRAYRVLRPRAQRAASRGLPGLRAPLIGRKHEMAALRRAVDLMREGHGQIVAVMGEAGLGKSRLLAELSNSLHDSGLLDPSGLLPGASLEETPAICWLEGRSFSYETSTPYAPFAALLAKLFGLQNGQPAVEAYQRLENGLVSLLPGHVGEPAIYLAALLGLAPAAEEQRMDPQQLRAGIFDAVCTVVKSLAQQRPTLLMLEDIHWIDPTSLDLLIQLLSLTLHFRLMIVALLRQRPQELSWRFHEEAGCGYSERYTSIVLGRLNDDNAQTLVDQLLHAGALPDSVRQMILAKAEGNPFYVEEVIRSLLDAGWLARENGQWRITRAVEQIAVPDTLAGVITARLDRLDELSKRVAQSAAVIGREFDFDTLAEISGMNTELDAVLMNLQQRDLVHETQRQPRRIYMFKHVLTQETVYASLLLSRRRELHRRAAEVLERGDPDNVNEIARHFLEARVPERALPYFIAAGDRAARAYAAREAIVQYSYGVEAASLLNAPPPVQLYRARGRVYDMIGEFEAAQADYNAALQAAQAGQDRQGEWQTLLDLGELWSARDYQESGRYFEQALELVRTLDESVALAHTLNRLGNWYLNSGRAILARRHHEEALAIFERLNDKRGLAETLDLLALSCALGPDDLAAANYYRRAISLFRELDERQRLASSLTLISYFGGVYLLDIGLPGPFSVAERLATNDEALAIARSIHYRAGEAFAYIARAFALGSLGEISQALYYAQSALEIAQAIDHRQWLCGAHVVHAFAYCLSLAFDKAQRHLEQSLPLARALKSSIWIDESNALLTVSALWQNDFDAAQALLDENCPPETPMEMAGHRFAWYLRAELALAQQDAETALDIVERICAAMVGFTTEQDVPILALVRGEALAALGITAEAETMLRYAELGAQEQGKRPLLWRVYRAQAKFYAGQGRHDEARHAVAQGRSVVEAIAATVPDDALRAQFIQRALATFELNGSIQ
jgi:class 3 adenylate cyclase/tetratricopeptide (TPR) repeat protein